MNRFVILLLTVIAAIVLNLLTCRWGTAVNSTSIMTFTQEVNGTNPVGMFTAPFLDGAPGLLSCRDSHTHDTACYRLLRCRAGEQPKNAVK